MLGGSDISALSYSQQLSRPLSVNSTSSQQSPQHLASFHQHNLLQTQSKSPCLSPSSTSSQQYVSNLSSKFNGVEPSKNEVGSTGGCGSPSVDSNSHLVLETIIPNNGQRSNSPNISNNNNTSQNGYNSNNDTSSNSSTGPLSIQTNNNIKTSRESFHSISPLASNKRPRLHLNGEDIPNNWVVSNSNS